MCVFWGSIIISLLNFLVSGKQVTLILCLNFSMWTSCSESFLSSLTRYTLILYNGDLQYLLPIYSSSFQLYQIYSFFFIKMASNNKLTLDLVREFLIRQEDSIIFSLIERAKFPNNSQAYDSSYLLGNGLSIAELFVKESESLHAKVGLYQKPENVPFFPKDLPSPLIGSSDSQVLYLASSQVTVNDEIWKFYFNDLLPLFTQNGDDGNYAETISADLACLQAISRRIHYGKYVAEVKFIDAPQDYIPLIQAKDRDALMKLLTFEAVEEAVKKRVEKKTRVFSQNVTLDEGNIEKYKVDPAIVARLYDKWVMPLTKLVEVDYLLLRLD